MLPAATRRLFVFSRQSQVTPNPCKRKAAGALNSSVGRGLLCSNGNEKTASGCNAHL